MVSCDLVGIIFKSLISLVSCISFLFTGLSFGGIPPYRVSQQFMITYARGCALSCLVIFIPFVVYSMQHNIDSQFIFSFVILVWMVNIATTACIDYKLKYWIFGHVVALFLILIKLSFTSFKVASECLDDGLKINTFHFNSLICELALLLIYSPLPFALLHDGRQSLIQSMFLTFCIYTKWRAFYCMYFFWIAYNLDINFL